MNVNATSCKRVTLGRLGEHKTRVIRFDISAMKAEFPTAEFMVLNRRPTESAAYPVSSSYVTVEGDHLDWTIQSGDLLYHGMGECELVASVDDKIAKSQIYLTEVLKALDGAGNPPEPWESWVEDVEDAADRAEAAAAVAVHAPVIEDGVWYVWDADAGEYVSTGVTARGEDGHDGQDGTSPVATVTKSGSTATISITDKTGTTTATVSDGDPSAIIDDTATTGDTGKVWSADKSAGLLSAIDGLKFIDNGLVNLYEPQDISQILDDEILKRGVPQSQYGSGNFVTDYIPVTGGKTIKLNFAPWGSAQAVWRAAEYASDKSYITYIENTEHTLSANAAFIRLTVNKSQGDHSAAVNLAYINANLQITDGSIGESSRYLDREDATYMNDSTVRKSDGFFVDASQDEILVMWKMPGKNNKDVGIKMKSFTKNNAYSFSSFGTADNKTEYVGNKPSNYVEYMSTGEDHFSPFAVFAVNNIDGDYTDTTKYTGGFHRIESVDTARRVSLDMYFDGRKISGFVGYCKTIDIVIVHAIQASNTFKDAGTGREVLQQTVRLHFENGKIDVETTVKALESIVIKEWFFIQGHHKSDGLGSNGIRYIGGDANRGINSMDSASNSGDKYARTMRFLSDTLQMDMTMDEYDAGRFQYDSQSYSCDIRAYTNYSKAYFEAVSQTGNNCALDENETITARGSYRFGIFE